MGITNDIAVYVNSFQFELIPEDAVQTIKNAFVDTIGVAVAGGKEDTSRIVFNYVKSQKANPNTTIWGKNDKTSAELSALVNGTMAHALDFDDVNSTVQGHPSTAIVPAVMSIIEELNLSGKDAILAYFVGFEVMAYLGKLVGFGHYRKGWHATSTLGVIGCTAVVGKLYGLSVEKLENAFGIAVSHSSGTRQNFGTMTKPYHPGHAARSGITAVKLANEGFTANREIVESPLGFLNLYSNNTSSFSKEKIGETIELISSGLSVKKYPCCYATHRPIDAMFELIKREKFQIADINEMTVKAPKGAFAPVIHNRPKKGLEGKFSVEYTIAAALLDKKVVLDSFNDENVSRPEVQGLLKQVKKIEDSSIKYTNSALEEGFVEIIVKFKNGRVISQKIEHPKGSPSRPLTQEELREKFMDCTKDQLTLNKSDKVFTMMQNLEKEKSLREVNGLISGDLLASNYRFTL
jgi:2-methylcitrate dehydratase PrpD